MGEVTGIQVAGLRAAGFRAAGLPAGSARSRRWGWAGPVLTVAATTFNLVLCFINTKHWMTVGTLHVALCSLAIEGAGLLVVWQDVGLASLEVAALTGLGVAGLAALNPALDLKIVFDLAIPPVFFLLGRRTALRDADRVLGWLLVLVIAVGLVEIEFTDLFQTQLDILGFYTNKGLVDVNATNYNANQFFTSAERSADAGRTMLPFLFGPHRVSSIFLEPISMGGFPIVGLAWLLSVRLPWTFRRWMLLCGIGLCIVLPDSRYAALSCLLLAAFRFVPWRTSSAVAALLPIAAVLGLLLLGAATLQPFEVPLLLSDDFPGRLTYSGKLLFSWGWADWLNLDPTPTYTSDTGYAYLVKGVGLPLALLLLFHAASGRLAGRAATMRGMVALYAATALCIGASFFSIKTAGLLWFLYGAAQDEGPGA